MCVSPRRKLRAAVERSGESVRAVFADTDHLAACVLTKLALATCHSVVVPLSFDDGDFNRLFQDVTGNALMTDVMLPMDAKGQLRARREDGLTPECPPSKTNRASPAAASIRRSNRATRSWRRWMGWRDKCGARARTMHGTRRCSATSTSPPQGQRAGTWPGAFTSAYFTAMKIAPDLAANISKMNGLPICVMTSEKYVAPSGLEGQKRETRLGRVEGGDASARRRHLDETYNAPIAPS